MSIKINNKALQKAQINGKEVQKIVINGNTVYQVQQLVIPNYLTSYYAYTSGTSAVSQASVDNTSNLNASAQGCLVVCSSYPAFNPPQIPSLSSTNQTVTQLTEARLKPLGWFNAAQVSTNLKVTGSSNGWSQFRCYEFDKKINKFTQIYYLANATTDALSTNISMTPGIYIIVGVSSTQHGSYSSDILNQYTLAISIDSSIGSNITTNNESVQTSSFGTLPKGVRQHAAIIQCNSAGQATINFTRTGSSNKCMLYNVIVYRVDFSD